MLLIAVMSAACGAVGSPPSDAEGAATRAAQQTLFLESEEGVWGGTVLRHGARTWVAAALHVENKLGVWAIDPDRTSKGPLLGDTGYHPDGVAVWDESAVAVAVEGIRRLQLWRIKGDTLVKEADLPTVFPARDLVTADLDRDGNLDVVLAPYSGDQLAVMWGMGGFNFSKPQMLQGGSSGWHPVVVDFDGDGRLDLVWAELDTGVVRYARNEGNRAFAVSELHKVQGVTARQLAVGDVNQDGRLDIVVAVEVGDAEVLLGKADGGFDRRTIPPRALGHVGVVVKQDGTVLLSDEGEVTLFRLVGDAWEGRRMAVGSMPAPISLERVDDDEHDDLLVYHSSGSGGVHIHFGPIWERAEPLAPKTK